MKVTHESFSKVIIELEGYEIALVAHKNASGDHEYELIEPKISADMYLEDRSQLPDSVLVMTGVSALVQRPNFVRDALNVIGLDIADDVSDSKPN
jgi:hypothetical protein